MKRLVPLRTPRKIKSSTKHTGQRVPVVAVEPSSIFRETWMKPPHSPAFPANLSITPETSDESHPHPPARGKTHGILQNTQHLPSNTGAEGRTNAPTNGARASIPIKRGRQQFA